MVEDDSPIVISATSAQDGGSAERWIVADKVFSVLGA
jgi:hypothetical protein